MQAIAPTTMQRAPMAAVAEALLLGGGPLAVVAEQPR